MIDHSTFDARSSALTAKWEAKIRERQAKALLDAIPVEVELPDGDPVLAVRASLLTIFEAGRIPDALSPFVLDVMALSADADVAPGDVEAELNRRWGEWLQVLDVVWMASVVSPKFTTGAPKSGFLSVRHVALSDKIALFNWGQGVSDHLAAFRDAEGGVPRAVADEPGVSEVHGGGAPGGEPLRGPVAELADQPADDAVGAAGRPAARRAKGRAGHAAQA